MVLLLRQAGFVESVEEVRIVGLVLETPDETRPFRFPWQQARVRVQGRAGVVIHTHQPGIADHVGRQDGGKSSLDSFFGHVATLSPTRAEREFYGSVVVKSMKAKQ
jgi:hypothetical protein